MGADTVLTAPELIDLETLNALRKLDQAGTIPARRKADLPTLLHSLRIRKYRHDILLEDVWALRDKVTACDAAYVMLGRRMNATLVTRDTRLAKHPVRASRC